MKKFLFMAVALVMGASVFTSCEDNEDMVMYKTLTFEERYFESYIDDPQYNGPLIYSGDQYVWTDDLTKLSSFCDKADWSQWGYGYGYGWNNGIAISDYIDDDPNAGYKKQLSVPESNGSKNFAVVWENNSELKFADGKARRIVSMQVSPTTYCLNNVQKNCGPGYEFKVTAVGTKADGSKTMLDIVLAKGTDVKTGWFDVDMSSLGEVKSVTFSFDGTDKSSNGFNTPKYFAFDNVVVEIPVE